MVPGESTTEFQQPRPGKQGPIIGIAELIISTRRAERIHEEAQDQTFKNKQKMGKIQTRSLGKKRMSFFDV